MLAPRFINLFNLFLRGYLEPKSPLQADQIKERVLINYVYRERSLITKQTNLDINVKSAITYPSKDSTVKINRSILDLIKTKYNDYSYDIDNVLDTTPKIEDVIKTYKLLEKSGIFANIVKSNKK